MKLGELDGVGWPIIYFYIGYLQADTTESRLGLEGLLELDFKELEIIKLRETIKPSSIPHLINVLQERRIRISSLSSNHYQFHPHLPFILNPDDPFELLLAVPALAVLRPTFGLSSLPLCIPKYP